ncbi:MAG: DUF1501 domain-containing protein [Litorilituus sp.]|nr:DUF1501 domain-containing protein [Litorilituus sp.]
MKNINDQQNNPDDNSTALSRRKFIQMTGASLAILSFPMSSAFAYDLNKTTTNKKIIWLVLRGGQDSLHTIVPAFDPQYKALRPKLSSSFKVPLLSLEKGFALHPSLKHLHTWYQEKDLLPIVAVSSGYPRRSHFDGQDFLESGKGDIDHDSGWLARAIDVKNKRALAVSRITPISLRSSEQVNTWYPSNLKNADGDIYDALAKLYQYDERLKESLDSGLAVRGLVGGAKNNKKKRQGKFIDLAKGCAKLMVDKQGADCAMLELGGWDTHNNQSGRLEQKLTELDNGLAELKLGLGKEWSNTVVVIGTEFGRTVKENGTGGTDHGTGSALFLAGGAVAGGKVEGKWPGLKTQELYEQRDLMPTSNSFAWIGSVLAQHWQFSEQELKQVFPHMAAYNNSLLSC